MAGTGFRLSSKDDIVIQAEHLDRRVTIQQPVDTPDGQNGFTRTWSTVISTYAHLEPWKGKELFVAQQVYPQFYMRVIIRYRPTLNITDKMRLLYGTRIYNIRSIGVPGEAMKVIELLCEELQSKGSMH